MSEFFFSTSIKNEINSSGYEKQINSHKGFAGNVAVAPGYLRTGCRRNR
jgi:hypothetical protein